MALATTALVFAGGPERIGHDRLNDVLRARDKPEGLVVVAADSGLDHAAALGVEVDVVVGDLDSVGSVALDAARVANVTIEEHPADKNKTDLALALDAALDRGALHIVIAGGGAGSGGRLDHLIGNFLLAGAVEYSGARIELRVTEATAYVVRDTATISGVPGDLVSLFALGGPALNVTTSGLRWALAGDTLAPGSSRGTSNELVTEHATVQVDSGTLLVIHELAALA